MNEGTDTFSIGGRAITFELPSVLGQ